MEAYWEAHKICISKYSEEILGRKINNKNKFPLLAKVYKCK